MLILGGVVSRVGVPRWEFYSRTVQIVGSQPGLYSIEDGAPPRETS